MRAVQNRNQQRLVHRVIAMDVFDLDGRVIDQHPDRKRDSAQRHRVDGLAGEMKAAIEVRIDSGIDAITMSMLAASR